jgi:hypothetical protein
VTTKLRPDLRQSESLKIKNCGVILCFFSLDSILIVYERSGITGVYKYFELRHKLILRALFSTTSQSAVSIHRNSSGA